MVCFAEVERFTLEHYEDRTIFRSLLSPDFLIPFSEGNITVIAYASEAAFLQKACRRALRFSSFILSSPLWCI